VLCNDELGGYQATSRLLRAGHRDILLLNGPGYISSAAERQSGYLRAHAEAGVAVAEERLVQVPVTAVGVAAVMERLLENSVSFSAIVAFSDIIAWHSWACLLRHGLRVPEDVSLIGFDHTHSRLELPFQLTSISSHKRRMSTTAVDVLLADIGARRHGKPEGISRQIVMDTTLSEGQTVRALPSAN
jgi:LacI family transcriptional regulator